MIETDVPFDWKRKWVGRCDPLCRSPYQRWQQDATIYAVISQECPNGTRDPWRRKTHRKTVRCIVVSRLPLIALCHSKWAGFLKSRRFCAVWPLSQRPSSSTRRSKSLLWTNSRMTSRISSQSPSITSTGARKSPCARHCSSMRRRWEWKRFGKPLGAPHNAQICHVMSISSLPRVFRVFSPFSSREKSTKTGKFSENVWSRSFPSWRATWRNSVISAVVKLRRFIGHPRVKARSRLTRLLWSPLARF